MEHKLVSTDIWVIAFSCKPAFILYRLQLTPRPMCWLIPQPRTTSSHNAGKKQVQTCITVLHWHMCTHTRTHALTKTSSVCCPSCCSRLFSRLREKFSSSVTGWSAVAVARVRCPIGFGRFTRPRCCPDLQRVRCQVRSQGLSLHSTAHLSVTGTVQEAPCTLEIQSCWRICEVSSKCLFEKRKMCLYVWVNSRPLKQTVALCVPLLSP